MMRVGWYCYNTGFKNEAWEVVMRPDMVSPQKSQYGFQQSSVSIHLKKLKYDALPIAT